MRGLVALVALLLGCGRGAYLVISSDVPIDRVEVFVATSPCFDMDPTDGIDPCGSGVGWQGQLQRAPGRILYLRDEGVIETTEIDDDGHAVIQLQTAGPGWTPIAIALVGYKDGQAVGAARLAQAAITADPERWNIHLTAFAPASEDVMTPPGAGEPTQRIHVWDRRNKDETFARCLAYQTWDAGDGGWQTDYYGPASDPDCDDQPEDLECDIHWYDRAPGAGSDCLFDANGTAPGACQLATSSCADGIAKTPTCAKDDTRPRHCFPDELCRECGAAGRIEDCARDQLPTNMAMTSFACTFIPSPQGTPCSSTGVLAGSFALPVGCSGAVIRTMNDPLGLQMPGVDVLDVNGATLAVAHYNDLQNNNLCFIELKWMGPTTGGSAWILVDVFYPTRHIFLPVELIVGPPSDDCTNAAHEFDCVPRGTQSADTIVNECPLLP